MRIRIHFTDLKIDGLFYWGPAASLITGGTLGGKEGGGGRWRHPGRAGAPGGGRGGTGGRHQQSGHGRPAAVGGAGDADAGWQAGQLVQGNGRVGSRLAAQAVSQTLNRLKTRPLKSCVIGIFSISCRDRLYTLQGRNFTKLFFSFFGSVVEPEPVPGCCWAT